MSCRIVFLVALYRDKALVRHVRGVAIISIHRTKRKSEFNANIVKKELNPSNLQIFFSVKIMSLTLSMEICIIIQKNTAKSCISIIRVKIYESETL